MAKRALLLGRNDDDALQWCCRYNDPKDPDGLGECDVRRIRDALLGHGYEVQVVPERCREEEDVSSVLKDALRRCTAGDDFLFYFSGHLRTDAGLGHKTAHPLSRAGLMVHIKQWLAGATTGLWLWYWADLRSRPRCRGASTRASIHKPEGSVVASTDCRTAPRRGLRSHQTQVLSPRLLLCRQSARRLATR